MEGKAVLRGFTEPVGGIPASIKSQIVLKNETGGSDLNKLSLERTRWERFT